MHYQTLCPHCTQSFEIDDADYEISACPHCGFQWICNLDAEPEGSLAFSPRLLAADLEPDSFSAMEVERDDWTKLIARRKSPRKHSSLLQMILPPVLGAIAAVFISISILWYGFGRDFANAGPTVSKYVPWIVPEELRVKKRVRYRPSQRSDPTSGQQGSFGTTGVMHEPDLAVRPVASGAQPEFNKMNRIAASIERPTEKRDWSEEKGVIYDQTLKIAEPWQRALEIQKETPPTPQSLRDLLNQIWFRDLIQQAGTEIPLPAESGGIAHIITSIEWNLSNPEEKSVKVTPEYGRRSVVWTLSDAVERYQLREKEGRISNGDSLLLGTVERIDAHHAVIRIDAIIR